MQYPLYFSKLIYEHRHCAAGERARRVLVSLKNLFDRNRTILLPKLIHGMNGSLNATRLKRIRDRKVRAWLLYQVLLPVSVVVLCYPLSVALQVDHSFYRSFVSGDLLLLAALLCIGIFVEIRVEAKDESSEIKEVVDPKDRLDKLFHWNVMLSLFFWVCFIVAKLASMKFEFPQVGSTNPTIPEQLYLSALLSIVGGVAGIAWARWAFKRLYEILLDWEIQEVNAANH